MAKITETKGYHIVVEPTKRYKYICEDVKPDEQLKVCEDMVNQIKRHVDNVEHVVIVEDNKSYCEYCGEDWSVDGEALNGCLIKTRRKMETYREKIRYILSEIDDDKLSEVMSVINDVEYEVQKIRDYADDANLENINDMISKIYNSAGDLADKLW